MAIESLTLDDAIARIGQRHGRTGLEYPRPGMQPYFKWLIASLELLAEASAGDLRVVRDDASATTVRVMPGRASIAGAVLAFDGEAIDLASFNNDTALIWVEDDAGAAIGSASTATGWPAGAHLKLAEVTLDQGAITGILDRRFETILKV